MLRATCLIFLASLLAGCGISGNLRHHPGFADFETPQGRGIDRVMAVSLGPLPLGMARLFIDREDRRMLRGVKAVRVYVYEVDRNRRGINGRIETMADNLVHAGWEPMVSVREDGELVRALARVDSPERISGLAVLIGEDDEIVLVNLIGDLRPERFNDYMRDYDIDAPTVTISGPDAQTAATSP